MKIEPSWKNKEKILKKKPLTNCHLQSGWNNSGWIADLLSIYPNRSKTDKTYENNRENIVQMKRRNDRLSKEAIEANKFVWKLQDEESDDEVQAKLNRLKQMSG